MFQVSENENYSANMLIMQVIQLDQNDSMWEPESHPQLKDLSWEGDLKTKCSQFSSLESQGRYEPSAMTTHQKLKIIKPKKKEKTFKKRKKKSKT